VIKGNKLNVMNAAVNRSWIMRTCCEKNWSVHFYAWYY